VQNGVVKSFNAERGFGFIHPEDGGQDVFVDIRAIERAGVSRLVEGQKVRFEMFVDRRSGEFSADELVLATAD
jgi:CspA family cold shock protein